ncbi:hypothetical protein ACJ6WF_47890 [Streptomyces sp. MMS24-I2-30]|uniref:hypothetical protein n=1 Tax=Streptomyces sp. MMS24-I2-30 TaxID=3351564 RepID=UPI003896B7CF
MAHRAGRHLADDRARRVEDPCGQRAHRGPAGLQRHGELDEAELGEGVGRVAGAEEGTGGVGGGTGAALGRRQLGGAQAAGRGDGGVDVAEVAVDPDPVERALAGRQRERLPPVSR